MSSEAVEFLQKIARPGPQEIAVDGRLLRPGCRVRLKPRPGGDILSLSLAGRTAVIEAIEEDDGGAAHVCVVVEDDPGRDLAGARHPAHRFLFAPDEIEPADVGGQSPGRRVLVAGIGNVFFGDDGFGPAVARRLSQLQLPGGVEAADFGIRGLDLAYALGQGYDAAILVDTITPRGYPGRLHVIEPDTQGHAEEAAFESHRLDPVAVLNLARRLGGAPPRVFLVGCEPADVGDSEPDLMNLSTPVTDAVEKAVRTVLDMACHLLAGRTLEAEAEAEGGIKEGALK